MKTAKQLAKRVFRSERRRPNNRDHQDEEASGSTSTSVVPAGPPPAYAERAPPPRPPTFTAPERTERFGLFLLYESAEGENQFPVDIVAVHGLNGDAYTTWTHENGTMWLQSVVPKYLPGCRVYTYGYPSQVVFSKSLASVREFAEGLLSSVRDQQEKSANVWAIPVSNNMFHQASDPDNCRRTVDHSSSSATASVASFANREALVFAHQDDRLYGSFLKSIIGVAFLGTPHRGSKVADLGTIVATIIDICSKASTAGLQSGFVRSDLLKQLKSDARALDNLSDDVKNRFENMTIVSFYETQKLLSQTIVEKASAKIGIPHEEVRPLYANHRDLCRFEGETSDCKQVCEALRRIALHQQRVRDLLTARASTPVSQASFNAREKACLRLFNPFDMADYRRRLPVPVEGTCEWILKHDLFSSWYKGSGNALLWLTGHPGCGKTMLSLSLACRLEETNKNAIVYFCDGKVSVQKDARYILGGLISQLMERDRKMRPCVARTHASQGNSMLHSMSALWGTFNDMIKHSTNTTEPLYVIVDALDECEQTSCEELLRTIREYLSTTSEDTSMRVKYLLTSRPALGQAYVVKEFLEKYQLPIDCGQPGYGRDIHMFIQRKVDEIAVKRRCSEDTKKFLIEALLSKADQTFLWVHIVIAKLEQTHLTSANEFRNIISNLPTKLETLYLGFIASIPSRDQEAASQLLQLLLASSRSLLLEELNTAFAIMPTHSSTEDVAKNSQSDMAGALIGILGPLVRISDSTVSLVHQTAKDFLLAQKSDSATRTVSDRCPTISAITTENSALRMAFACIRYLLLTEFSRNWYGRSASEDTRSEFSSSDSNSVMSVPGFALFEEEDGPGDGDDKDRLFFFESDDLEAKVSHNLATKHAFYGYSALHWAEHLALCEDQAPSELLDAARSLLDIQTAHCRNWLHFHQSEVAAADVLGAPSALALAAYFNLRATVADILAKDDPSQADQDQALLLSARAGHTRVVHLLLDANANPKYRNTDAETALSEAAANGQLDSVLLLLSSRGGIEAEHVARALNLAAGNGHHSIVQHLLDHAMNAGEPHLDGTPLIRAVCAGHLPIVMTLTKHKAIDVNHRDRAGRTPLSWAAGDGMNDVVKYLLKQRRVDTALPDQRGRTPLSWAAGNGHARVVELMVTNKNKKGGIEKSQVDRDGRTPLSWACGQGREAAVRALLAHGCGAQVNEGDIDGWTPLAWAIHQDQPAIVEAVINAGVADLEKLEGSRTVLAWAVEYGHLEVVRTLLRKGADPASAAELVPKLRAGKKEAMTNVISMYLNRRMHVAM